MDLYYKKGSRYLPATPGMVVAAAQDQLHKLGQHEVARGITVGLLDRVGYELPTEPDINVPLPPGNEDEANV